MRKIMVGTRLVLLVILLGLITTRLLQAADAVVGTGTPASCTEAAFNTALATVQSSGSGAITFNCGGAMTIVFTASKIISNAAVTINGGGNITLSGGNAIRPFYVDNNATLILQNITVSNGLDNTYGGGAILSLGGLTLTNTTIRDSNVNSAYSGGAIMSLGGLVSITNSLIENNSGGSAGGLYLFGETADATITNSTFSNNYTTNINYGLGGAITTWDGADLIVRGSTFSGNKAQDGGAIYNESANTTILIEQNSVLQGNSAGDGGGIYNSAGEITLNQVRFQQNGAAYGGGLLLFVSNSEANLFNVTFQANSAIYGGGLHIGGSNSSSVSLVNVTIQENIAQYSGGGISHFSGNVNIINGTVSDNTSGEGGGGGIAKKDGNMTLTHVTFSGNSAAFGGGGISHDTSSSQYSFTLKNVLFNAGENGDNCFVKPGSLSGISSAGFNLDSDYSCSFNQTGDQEGVDPRLGPLADNGGFTQTHMLLDDSPAIDAGQCMPGLTTDQRGLPRLQGGACDIGPVERQPEEGTFNAYLPFVHR